MGSGGIIAAKIGCAAQTLHEWVKKTEIDSGRCTGVPAEVPAQLKALQREEFGGTRGTVARLTASTVSSERPRPPCCGYRTLPMS